MSVVLGGTMIEAECAEKKPRLPKLLTALAGRSLLGFDTRAWDGRATALSQGITGTKPVFGGAKPAQQGIMPVRQRTARF